MFDLQAPAQTGQPQTPQEGLTELEQRVLEQIGSGELSADQVVEALGLSVPEVASALFELEVKGLLTCNAGLYAKSKF